MAASSGIDYASGLERAAERARLRSVRSTFGEPERLDVVVVGHVDHGKSTVIGRLMADTGSLPEGKLDQVKAMCERNARPFEYAFLLDALKNEQAQGITIDTARCFFKTERRHYILHDAPGHVEFLKNMITGASRAQAALLVIDAHEGVAENSKRHGYILSMLGIRQVAVLVNKMDLLDWDRSAFESVVGEYAAFLARLGVKPTCFIPISARDGINITERGDQAPWYEGPTVLEQVEAFESLTEDFARPFRMPLQDVYKFTAEGDDRRIFVGTIESGEVRPGDDVVFLPSGKRSSVRSIEVLEGEKPESAHAGQATGFTLDTQVYVKPGELVARVDQPEPSVSDRIRANVFWMGVAPLVKGRRYTLRMGAARVPVELEEVLSVLDASQLTSTDGATQVERHDVAEVILRARRPVAFDESETLETSSRFVIVHGHDIAGCGIALESLENEDDAADADRPFGSGLVSESERAVRYSHSGKTVVLVGESATRAHEVAAQLERRLFDLGIHSYFLGATDLSSSDVIARDELLVHVGRIAWAMADAGVVLVTALGDVDRFDLKRLRRMSAPHELFVIGLGEESSDGADHVTLATSDIAAVNDVVRVLASVGVLPDYEI